jgi:hypothetical protein
MRASSVRWIVAFMLLSLSVPAWAHAHLTASTPADGAVVRSPPASLQLDFTEAVQKRFSLFVVLPLSVPVEAGESAHDRSLRVHALAAQLADTVMADKGAVKGRVDTGLARPGGAAKQVTIELARDLSPGTYVLVWRALSVDTHVTHGIVVFTVASGG